MDWLWSPRRFGASDDLANVSSHVSFNELARSALIESLIMFSSREMQRQFARRSMRQAVPSSFPRAVPLLR